MQQDDQGRASEFGAPGKGGEIPGVWGRHLPHQSLCNLCELEARTLGVRLATGTCFLPLALGTRLYCPKEGFMLICGSCSSRVRKNPPKTQNPKLRHVDKSCGHFSLKG